MERNALAPVPGKAPKIRGDFLDAPPLVRLLHKPALEREAEHPSLLTNAYLDLPVLIVRRGSRDRYPQAIDILERHKGRLSFPVDRFLWNSVNAIILSETGQQNEARVAALAALEAAGMQDSGLRDHPSIGLVGSEYDDVLQRARKIANS
jgi:hypothetical protein